MKPLAKKIVLKRNSKHRWATEWKWACSICGKEYENQSAAQTCCLEKKDSTGRPWLKALQEGKESASICTPFGGRSFRKHTVSENRRCPYCKTKSYSKLLGDFMIYSYHCDKCGTVHSVYISNSIELLRILSKDKNQTVSRKLTLADVVNILESTPRAKLTAGELFNMLGLRR